MADEPDRSRRFPTWMLPVAVLAMLVGVLGSVLSDDGADTSVTSIVGAVGFGLLVGYISSRLMERRAQTWG